MARNTRTLRIPKLEPRTENLAKKMKKKEKSIIEILKQ